jgi:hypothetical protein
MMQVQIRESELFIKRTLIEMSAQIFAKKEYSKQMDLPHCKSVSMLIFLDLQRTQDIG